MESLDLRIIKDEDGFTWSLAFRSTNDRGRLVLRSLGGGHQEHISWDELGEWVRERIANLND